MRIYGNSEALKRLECAAPISNGSHAQVGLRRRVPEVDSWVYQSQRYAFRFDTLDVEVRDFLLSLTDRSGRL
jgi:hypothetical protein